MHWQRPPLLTIIGHLQQKQHVSGCMHVQVANTPEDHVTRDYQEGIASLADIHFRVVDTSGDACLCPLEPVVI